MLNNDPSSQMAILLTAQFLSKKGTMHFLVLSTTTVTSYDKNLCKTKYAVVSTKYLRKHENEINRSNFIKKRYIGPFQMIS